MGSGNNIYKGSSSPVFCHISNSSGDNNNILPFKAMKKIIVNVFSDQYFTVIYTDAINICVNVKNVHLLV